MNRTILTVLPALISFAFLFSYTQYAPASDQIEGKTFAVSVTEKGKKGEATPDELIFNEGTFFSTDCEQYGFGAAPYKAAVDGSNVVFESTLVSEKEGKTDWKGTIAGDDIKGTFVWAKEGQDPIHYEFQGSLKK